MNKNVTVLFFLLLLLAFLVVVVVAVDVMLIADGIIQANVCACMWMGE